MDELLADLADLADMWDRVRRDGGDPGFTEALKLCSGQVRQVIDRARRTAHA